MGKSIKLVTLVGDEEVVVGRCHPGQARILRKNGLAEWQKDKLVLQGASPPLPKLSTFGLPREVTEGFVAGSLAPPQGGEWKGYGTFTKKVTFQDNAWMEEAEEIDPDGLLMTFGWGDAPAYGKDLRMAPEEILCETLAMWAGEAIKRREAGHTLLSADAPKRLMLGFVDDNTNEVLYVGLRKIKSAQESDLTGLGVSRSDLKTNEGRAVLLGLDPSDARWSPVVEPDPDLEAIWVQEVEDSLGAATRKAEGIKLADEWSRRGLDKARKAIVDFTVTDD